MIYLQKFFVFIKVFFIKNIDIYFKCFILLYLFVPNLFLFKNYLNLLLVLLRNYENIRIKLYMAHISIYLDYKQLYEKSLMKLNVEVRFLH